jgi:hypothetical protein
MSASQKREKSSGDVCGIAWTKPCNPGTTNTERFPRLAEAVKEMGKDLLCPGLMA